jgi:hypothetical protein
MLLMTLKNYRFIFLFLIISTLTTNAFALDLSSTITSSSNRVQSGASVTYTGTVINNSSTSATNSQLIFYMPPRNVNYISLPVGCTIKVKITCLLGDLVGGASVSKSITVSYSNSGAAVVSALAVTESADSNINNNASRLTANVAKSGANSVTIPSISSVNPIPVSATMGNSINFSASLSGNLPSGYSVKLNYSNSTISMSGSGTSFSAVQAPTQIGQQVFSVGIYDANNILKSNTLTGNFEIVKANTVPTLSFISGNTTATAGTSYSVQLQASDVDNNLKSIMVIWGDGASDTQNATNGTTLTFTHTYATANTYNWSATALDLGNASSIAVSKNVTVSATVVAPPVSTSGYTKISNSGIALPDTAILGSGANDWACTKDNKTGLIWEVKTDDGGLRDIAKRYSNYTIDYPNDSSNAALQYPLSKFGDITNTDGFVNAVNSQILCGAANWRLPTKEEMVGLVYCSDGMYKTLGKDDYGSICINGGNITKPTINANYFPNTQAEIYYGYWTSYYSNYSWASPATLIEAAWAVYFYYGYTGDINRFRDYYVRLVHDSQPPPTTSAYTKISNTGVTLPDTAVLGSGPNDWACTKDNKTGLTWEVKTTDGGLRDWKNYYSWYEPDTSKNGGNAGDQNRGICKGSQCDTYAFTNAVNAQGLCGKNDWRVPTINELKGLVSKTRTVNQPLGSELFIDANYFPNTYYEYYWSSSSVTSLSSQAWFGGYYEGLSYYGSKYINSSFVRLVR